MLDVEGTRSQGRGGRRVAVSPVASHGAGVLTSSAASS